MDTLSIISIVVGCAGGLFALWAGISGESRRVKNTYANKKLEDERVSDTANEALSIAKVNQESVLAAQENAEAAQTIAIAANKSAEAALASAEAAQQSAKSITSLCASLSQALTIISSARNAAIPLESMKTTALEHILDVLSTDNPELIEVKAQLIKYRTDMTIRQSAVSIDNFINKEVTQ